MPVWKHAKNKQITEEEIERVLSSLVCFKCGKELHSDDCPFAKLRSELIALRQTSDASKHA
jgi:hypothetical protein